jgi:hypothetical protein
MQDNDEEWPHDKDDVDVYIVITDKGEPVADKKN